MTENSDRILWIVVGILGVVLVSMSAAMLYGLYDLRVDNKAIFAILGPAFQQISGGFMTILGAKFMGKSNG